MIDPVFTVLPIWVKKSVITLWITSMILLAAIFADIFLNGQFYDELYRFGFGVIIGFLGLIPLIMGVTITSYNLKSIQNGGQSYCLSRLNSATKSNDHRFNHIINAAYGVTGGVLIIVSLVLILAV